MVRRMAPARSGASAAISGVAAVAIERRLVGERHDVDLVGLAGIGPRADADASLDAAAVAAHHGRRGRLEALEIRLVAGVHEESHDERQSHGRATAT